MQRRLRGSLIVAGLVAAFTVAAPTAAFADSSECSVPSGTCAGKVTFQSYGELFRIYDQSSDGHSAVLLYWLSDGTGPYYGWNHSGTGTEVDVDLALAEGDWIFYKACLGEYGTKTLVAGTCSPGVTDYA
jgi:hypothetical protein